MLTIKIIIFVSAMGTPSLPKAERPTIDPIEIAYCYKTPQGKKRCVARTSGIRLAHTPLQRDNQHGLPPPRTKPPPIQSIDQT